MGASPSPPTQLGNVWIIAATIAISLVGRSPAAVTIDADGKLEAVGADHPEFQDRLLWPGYVCMVDGSSDVERIAGRIRDAALAVDRAPK